MANNHTGEYLNATAAGVFTADHKDRDSERFYLVSHEGGYWIISKNTGMALKASSSAFVSPSNNGSPITWGHKLEQTDNLEEASVWMIGLDNPAPPLPESVKINRGVSYTLQLGDITYLYAGIKPLEADKTQTWWSSNEKVVTVSDRGIITAVNYGKATIYVKTFNGLIASCEITVPRDTTLLGDVDSDGTVAIFDATAIQRKVADLSTTAFVESAADADGDGSITVLDATAIQRHLAGLSANEKIGKSIT